MDPYIISLKQCVIRTIEKEYIGDTIFTVIRVRFCVFDTLFPDSMFVKYRIGSNLDLKVGQKVDIDFVFSGDLYYTDGIRFHGKIFNENDFWYDRWVSTINLSHIPYKNKRINWSIL